MKLAVMQPYFFPYIGYFQLISVVDKFIIYDDVNYINRGWINRNNILINGKAGLITLPLCNATQNRYIKDIVPDFQNKQRDNILRTIEHSYKKSSYFNAVFNILNNLFNIKSVSISEFNYICIQSICDYLGITTKLIPSSTIYENIELSGQNRIIDICKKENASSYFNPIGGTELYDKECFRKEGLDIYFIKTNTIVYKQYKNSDKFVPNLSVIDLIMNNSISEIQIFLKQFNLI
jgi:hypothetical protein